MTREWLVPWSVAAALSLMAAVYWDLFAESEAVLAMVAVCGTLLAYLGGAVWLGGRHGFVPVLTVAVCVAMAIGGFNVVAKADQRDATVRTCTTITGVFRSCQRTWTEQASGGVLFGVGILLAGGAAAGICGERRGMRNGPTP